MPKLKVQSPKVIAGLSGGVDSAVSAALLKRAGTEVVGAFIKTWTPEWLDRSCTWREERRDAMRVAAHLDIPFVTIDLEKEYKESVVDYMISEYEAGRTPNPDVMCNKEVKFGAFLKQALEMGADAIATGHYAQINSPVPLKAGSPSLILREGKGELLRGVDPAKDQSYFLWTLTQEQLSRTIFPVGHLLKSEVRELARQFRLPVASKKDSQGICFLGHVDTKEFLSHYIKAERGSVLNLQGEKIGEHDGAVFYTLGQRLNGQYVMAKDMEKNRITVSDQTSKFKVQPNPKPQIMKLRDTNWISGLEPKNLKPITRDLSCLVRYHGEKLLCHITHDPHSVWPNECVVKFEKPVLAAPGQSLVFYNEEVCLGGGIIDIPTEI